MTSTKPHADPPSGAEPGARESRTVTVSGTRIRVEIKRGDRSVPPLVLCNGIGISFEALDAAVDEFSPHREVIRFDVPGVGGSGLPVRPYWLPEMALTMHRMLGKLGYREVDVLGISWGGALAQQYAMMFRRRCRRLVLVATGPGTLMVPAHPKVLGHLLSPRRHRDPEHSARIAAELYGGSARVDPKVVSRMLQRHTRTGPRRGYLYQLLAGVGWTSLPFLPTLEQRTLILAGDDDPIIPVINARVMAALIPRCTLSIYSGGHLGLLTESAQLVSKVEAFLDA